MRHAPHAWRCGGSGAQLKPRRAIHRRLQVSLLSSVLYYALTTGNGTPTLGEEYSDLHAVRRGRLPRQHGSAPQRLMRPPAAVAGGGRRAAAAVAAATRAVDCAAVRGAVLAGARAVRWALHSCACAAADLRFPHRTAGARFAIPSARTARRKAARCATLQRRSSALRAARLLACAAPPLPPPPPPPTLLRDAAPCFGEPCRTWRRVEHSRPPRSNARPDAALCVGRSRWRCYLAATWRCSTCTACTIRPRTAWPACAASSWAACASRGRTTAS